MAGRFSMIVTIGVTWILVQAAHGTQLPAVDRPLSQSALSQSASTQKQQESSEEPIPARVPVPAEIREIHEIRSLLGGGIGKQLEGLFRGDPQKWKVESEAEFQDELLRLARRVVQGDPKRDPKGPPKAAFKNESIMRAQAIQPLPPAGLASATGDRVSAVNWTRAPSLIRVRSRAQTEKLRSAARSLEGIAAEMEDARLFEAADQIRDNARQLWMQARMGHGMGHEKID